MTKRLKPFFSYYGAKWRASRYYSPPHFNRVVEPFAGSACYSLLHHRHDVLLVDADPTIANLWSWLICASQDEIRNLPDTVDDLSKIYEPARTLIGFWFVKGAVKPAPKPYAWARSGDWDDQFWGSAIKNRVASQLQYIRHWKVRHGCYSEIENEEATWFIDPPYIDAGKHYVCSYVDYEHLAEWCKSRLGQVIVCEQAGADWLPFVDFRTVKALKARQSKEVVFYHGLGNQKTLGIGE
jgi:hypothetical protein